MQLREEIHRTVDTLDNRGLALAYEFLRGLSNGQPAPGLPPRRHRTLNEIHALTAADKGNWAELIEQEREERP